MGREGRGGEGGGLTKCLRWTTFDGYILAFSRTYNQRTNMHVHVPCCSFLLLSSSSEQAVMT